MAELYGAKLRTPATKPRLVGSLWLQQEDLSRWHVTWDTHVELLPGKGAACMVKQLCLEGAQGP